MNRRQMTLAALAAGLPLTLSAQEAAPAGDIVVAQIGPFTVLPAPDPKELNEGLVAGFDEINGKGGINGRKVALVKLDDAYSYEGFKARLAEVMPRKPVALLTPLGSATLKAVLDNKLLDSTDIMILNAVPGAGVLREPGHPKFFHIRAGDAQQIQKIVAHARALNIRSMGVLYQDIPIGSSGLASAKAAASAANDGGGELQIMEAKSGTDDAAIAQAAKAIATAAPQSALVVGTPKFVASGVAALRAAGVSQMLFTLSYLPGSALLKAAGQGARGVGVAQTFPNPAGVSQPIQRAFRAAMQATHPGITTHTAFHMEGYITARVFAEAARRAKVLTPATLADALRRMGEIDLGGFRVNFSRGNVGSSWVDIAVVNGEGKLVY